MTKVGWFMVIQSTSFLCVIQVWISVCVIGFSDELLYWFSGLIWRIYHLIFIIYADGSCHKRNRWNHLPFDALPVGGIVRRHSFRILGDMLSTVVLSVFWCVENYTNTVCLYPGCFPFSWKTGFQALQPNHMVKPLAWSEKFWVCVELWLSVGYVEGKEV